MVSSFTSHHNMRISMVEGRAISKLIEAAKKEGHVEEEKMVRVVVRAHQIGSRPPRCERRCSGCGPCEAVQVPVVPQLLQNHHMMSRSRTTNNFFSFSGFKQLLCSVNCKRSKRTKNFVTYSRGDDFSNYKPMSWKCKCGDFLFNP
ncbi:hypothetical protein L484_026111 [Morus notabilis]|uniref:Epidermal patterning factor-like protein n=2 Tax=Morus notabilis TaxID=981085 RepID=W9RIL9_9ROSA|nr:hypothetical protein L484_026111 [Morus notabilis]